LTEDIENKNGEILFYTTDEGNINLGVLFSGETVWLTQAQMVELFQRDTSVIFRHIKNVFEEGELDKESNLHFMQIPNSDKPVAYYNINLCKALII